MKVCIDTNILGHSRGALKGQDVPALEEIAKGAREEVSFVVSDTVDRELAATKEDALRALLMFVARLSDRVEVVAYESLRPPAPPMIGGHPQILFWRTWKLVEDPLYTALRKTFDETDAQHIFIAIKRDCDYFLTIDYDSILDRVKQKQSEVDTLCGKLRIVSPSPFGRTAPRELLIRQYPGMM